MHNDYSNTPDFWVYILYCSNDSYYTGYTTHLINRYHAHLKGKASKYTRSFRPLNMACLWPIYGSKRQAMQIELFIKKMNKRNKSELFENPSLLEEKILKASL